MTDWTSLAHAVRWIAEGVEPRCLEEIEVSGDKGEASDDKYLRSRQDLIIALYQGKISAKCGLVQFNDWSQVSPFDSNREFIPKEANAPWVNFFAKLESNKTSEEALTDVILQKSQVVPSGLWSQDFVHWKSEALESTLPGGLSITLSQIGIEITKLKRSFQHAKPPNLAKKRVNVKTGNSKRGPDPKYEWHMFYNEAWRRVYHYGRPETQEHLVGIMEDWCENEQKETSGKSQLRKHISVIFHTVMRSDNS